MQIYGNGENFLTDKMIPDSIFNLWDGTSDFSGKSWVADSPVQTDNRLDRLGNKVVLRSSAWDGLSQIISALKGETYTLSAYVFTEDLSKTSIHFYSNVKSSFSDQRTNADQAYVKISTKGWIRISQTFTVLQDTDLQPRFENADGSNIYWGSFMLNRGPIALPWNLSINDLKGEKTS